MNVAFALKYKGKIVNINNNISIIFENECMVYDIHRILFFQGYPIYVMIRHFFSLVFKKNVYLFWTWSEQ